MKKISAIISAAVIFMAISGVAIAAGIAPDSLSVSESDLVVTYTWTFTWENKYPPYSKFSVENQVTMDSGTYPYDFTFNPGNYKCTSNAIQNTKLYVVSCSGSIKSTRFIYTNHDTKETILLLGNTVAQLKGLNQPYALKKTIQDNPFSPQATFYLDQVISE